VSDDERRRTLQPAPILPPPQSPGSYHGQQGRSSYPAPEAPPSPYTSAYGPRSYEQYQQPPSWPTSGPQWGYGSWPPPPPPRKRSALGRLLLGLVGVGAAVFFVLIVLGAATSDQGADRVGDIDHAPAQPSDPDSQPDSSGDLRSVLAANPLYQQGGLANGNCPAEDLGNASADDQTRFYDSLMDCLDREWGPPIKNAGFSYQSPDLVVFESPVTTPCGKASPQDGRTLAFYCPSDSVMYADVPQMRRFFGNLDIAYAILIGHEFGHHVQQEAGVLDGYEQAVYDDYDQRLALSRRVELQASCMGGLFLGAVAESFPVDEERFAQLDRVAGSFGDDPQAAANQRDHGSGRSNRTWIMRAFGDNDIAVCNTFTAAASQID
jgi:predicted metalloprotease